MLLERVSLIFLTLSFSPINLVGFEIIAGYSLYSGRVGQFKLVLEIKRDPSIRSPLNSVCCPQIVVSGEAVHENLQGLYTRAENKLNGRSKYKLLFTVGTISTLGYGSSIFLSGGA